MSASSGASLVRQLALVVVAIGGTTLFVWNKVQFEDASRRASVAEQRIEHLMEDQSKLRAKLMQKSTPGVIRDIAAKKLMMSRSESHRVLRVNRQVSGRTDG